MFSRSKLLVSLSLFFADRFPQVSTMKKFVTVALLCVVSFLPRVTLGVEAREVEAAIAAAMQALDQFMATFNRRDPVAWAATLNYPHVRFASGNVTVWENAEEFAAGGTFDRLLQAGIIPTGSAVK